jgi:V/A-type H+-transporting ATPase subunit D
MVTVRVPPGRSGRLWLRHRLAVAEHAADLLEQKLRILRREADRLRVLSDATRAAWLQQDESARTWLLRAALAGGERALRAATVDQPVRITVEWTTVVGVRCPGKPVVQSAAGPAPVGGAALVRATGAQRQAVIAAVEHAAASTAARACGSEIRAVTHRVRALRRHWIPSLRAALARAELELEEQERGEGIRRRWAAAAADRSAKPAGA